MPDRIRIAPSPATALWEAEAEALGVSIPMLLTADLVRLRALLQAAAPPLTAWEWGLVSHVLPDEGMDLVQDVQLGERIVSSGSLSATLQEWADGAMDGSEEQRTAEALARRALGWSDLERWALVVRKRGS